MGVDMYTGSSNQEDPDSEEKSNREQPNALTTTAVATTSTSLTTQSSARSISFRALATEITTCHQSGRELVALGRDLHKLLATEGPHIARLPEILARRLSTLFPFAQGDDVISQIQSMAIQFATFGVNPAVALFGAKIATDVGISNIEDQGKRVLEKAIQSAGGPSADALDLYHTCTGLYSLYNTYTELNRIYNSILFCSQRLRTSTEELAVLTHSNEQWAAISAAFSEYWNQPGFDFNAFLKQTAEQFQMILAPLQDMIMLYESMEPVRISTYLALTMQPEPNAKSQLEQVTGLLTTACCNTVLDNISGTAKNAGTALGKTLPIAGMKALANTGTKAALTACATAVTGLSFPITIAVLATCISNATQRKAFIAYAKSRITGLQVGETKSDENVQAIVSSELDALADENNSLFSQLKAKIPAKVSAAVDATATRCIDASGHVVGTVAEQAILTLMHDSDFVSTLGDQLNPVIYQILDRTLRTTLQIPEQKAFFEKIQSMSETEAAVYQACGALIPDMVNWLALPNLVETQLQAVTGNPDICSTTGKPSSLSEKVMQGITRTLFAGAKANVEAASTVAAGMIKASQAVKAMRGSENLLPPPVRLNNTEESALLTLGSTANHELATGLRIYLVLVTEDTPAESIPTPAILFSRKTDSRLGGLINSDSIEIRSFKVSKKTKGFFSALGDLASDRTRTISMESLENENTELKNQSIAVIQKNTSRTNPISSILLPLDHPLVKLMTERLEHNNKRFDYLKQHKMQKAALVVQQQRAIDEEAAKKQAAELAKIKEIAITCGFGETFFEDFNTTSVIQERYTRQLQAINEVDTWPIQATSDDDAIKVREYIKKRLTSQSAILLSHINAATERFTALKLNDFLIKTRLAEVEKAMLNVDNLGWFGSTWFAPTVIPEARTHYFALLELQKSELQKIITELEQPLKDFENGKYDDVLTYVTNHPESTLLFLTELELYKKTFWWGWWPADLLALETSLKALSNQNKPDEQVSNLRIHLPLGPAVPALMFAGVPKPNTSPNAPAQLESKLAQDDKQAQEEEEQLAKALALSTAEAASQPKIGPKTIAGWELTDVDAKGNCFYEAVALQLKKNHFPIAEMFPATKSENGGTALSDILRRQSTSVLIERDWADEAEILALAKALKIVIAIVDTRNEKHTFQYHFTNWQDGLDCTDDQDRLPNGQHIVELAYTGNHYLSVSSTPTNIRPRKA